MIPVNISSPRDVAIIFAVFALVIITVGFGVQSVIDNQDVEVNNSFYNNVKLRVTDASGLKGTADDMSSGLAGQEGSSNDPSEESLLVAGFNSIRKLGKTFKIMENSLSEGTGILGIDSIYWVIFTSVLLISFAVVMYTWLRGR